MTWTPLLAFAVIAMIFGIGDMIAAKTKGTVSSIIVVILVLLLFSSVFPVLPPDILAKSGLPGIISTFGMGLILVNLGSMLDLNDLKREWKTLLVSLAAVLGVVALQMTLGTALFGKEMAMAATGPTAGAMVATMILTEAANTAGRPEIAAFVAAVMALQVLIGMPIASFCLRQEAKRFINVGGHLRDATVGKGIQVRLLPPTPELLDKPNIHLARLALVAVLGAWVTSVTGIPTGITFLVGGIIFGAIGFIEPRALQRAGAEHLVILATYCSVVTGFVGMSVEQFGSLLLPVFSMLLIGALGVVAAASLVGRFLHWSPWLCAAVGICCVLGYPKTYAVSMEVAQGAVQGKNFSKEEEERVVQHLLPKMIVSGTVSVSVTSVVIASLVAPILFS